LRVSQMPTVASPLSPGAQKARTVCPSDVGRRAQEGKSPFGRFGSPSLSPASFEDGACDGLTRLKSATARRSQVIESRAYIRKASSSQKVTTRILRSFFTPVSSRLSSSTLTGRPPWSLSTLPPKKDLALETAGVKFPLSSGPYR